MATAVQGYEDFPVKDVQDVGNSPATQLDHHLGVDPLSSSQQLHATLHAENASRRLHPMEQRLYLLKRLGYVIQDNRKAISDSLYRDLGRSQEENEMGEVRFVALYPPSRERFAQGGVSYRSLEF
jgi:hypothetical protein